MCVAESQFICAHSLSRHNQIHGHTQTGRQTDCLHYGCFIYTRKQNESRWIEQDRTFGYYFSTISFPLRVCIWISDFDCCSDTNRAAAVLMCAWGLIISTCVTDDLMTQGSQGAETILLIDNLKFFSRSSLTTLFKVVHYYPLKCNGFHKIVEVNQKPFSNLI